MTEPSTPISYERLRAFIAAALERLGLRVAYARDAIPIAAGLMRNLNRLAAELDIARLA